MSNCKKAIFFTNDVETTSLTNHCLSDETGALVLKEGIPKLLDLYEKYDAKSTFFITGYIAEKYPQIVNLIQKSGHEVACHGYSHESYNAFDVLTYKKQVEHLSKSKKILEDICGQEVISFRAPALRVNEDTPKALIESGFKIDSSIASQRLDMFLSFGSLKKMKWINAPRHGYFTKYDDLSKKGESGVFEIPVISYGIPYIGTFMRISPILTSLVRQIAYWESAITNTKPVFLIHPNELFIEELDKSKFTRRSKNIVKYLLSDVIRHKLKLKNLGDNAVDLLEHQLKFFYSKNYPFSTLKDYYIDYVEEK